MLISDKKRIGIASIWIFLVVIAVGIGGWFSWQAYQNWQAEKNKNTADNILQIKELGIQMTLPSGLEKADVIYEWDATPATREDSDGRIYHVLGYVTFTTASLIAKDEFCAINDGFGIVAFYKLAEDTSGYAIGSGPSDIRRVGDFYMGFLGPQAACTEHDFDLEETQLALFLEAFYTITPIQ
ncbi:hypothetical protein A2797_02695 [candidate division WWE3 bacterium RIFCSPHIGHO2_01_FULL_48_15]|uniref:Uncharacterized protein n=1 Tax=candidate division WWE3 bacterium RIFCSPHIGHO2_01_FULL_48_15 TaxID=1802619 RepID=A0A1F4VFA3_UNCKA|nr:MAG: hypothetical protein A2797_02695 [candidate division WWE3 bacterium RIFCSPHIGHO2_01_FULL_48_15]